MTRRRSRRNQRPQRMVGPMHHDDELADSHFFNQSIAHVCTVMAVSTGFQLWLVRLNVMLTSCLKVHAPDRPCDM